MGFDEGIIALDTAKCRSSALLGQAEVRTYQWLCPPIPLRQALEILDGITGLRGIIPSGS